MRPVCTEDDPQGLREPTPFDVFLDKPVFAGANGVASVAVTESLAQPYRFGLGIAAILSLAGGLIGLYEGGWTTAVVGLSMAAGIGLLYLGAAPLQSAWLRSRRAIAGMALIAIAAITTLASVVSLLSA